MGIDTVAECFGIARQGALHESKSADTVGRVGFRSLNAVSFSKNVLALHNLTFSGSRSRPLQKTHPVVSLMDHVRPYFSY